MALTDDSHIGQSADRHVWPRTTPSRVEPNQLDSVCHVPSEQVVAMHARHIAEVERLRARIEELEAALDDNDTDGEPQVTTVRLVPTRQRRRSDNQAVTEEAAVQPVSSQHLPAEDVLDEMVSTVTSGAAAWDDEDVSFAERVAARAFFRDDVTDSRARRWLLRES